MNTKQQFDSTDLRKALGTFGTGVTVVTTLSRDKENIGVTANSFSSVSLDPAIVLWSLKKHSPSLQAFDDSGRFAVNVLTLEQMALSKRFASPIPNKFNTLEITQGLEGLPILRDCAAVFECKTIERLNFGDHILFLGEVQAYQHSHHQTLMFCRGKYVQGLELDTLSN
jgi:flavin reductase (DIM6/NTAB) family NADH-FMN oxidoreductase RutF